MAIGGAVRIWRQAFLAELAKNGNVTLSARAAGITRDAAYKARNRSQKFAVQWDAALQSAMDLLEAEAWRRAAVGYDEPVHYRGERVDVVRKYSDTLLIFLLKGGRPERYRDNVHHSGEIASQPGDRTVNVRVELVKADEPLADQDIDNDAPALPEMRP